MLFINNMIDTALLIELFAQHIGHSTAVMLLLFFRSHYLFNFHIHRWRRRRRASSGGDGGGGGCRIGGDSAVTTIDGATKLAGGVGGDVSRLSVAFCWGG